MTDLRSAQHVRGPATEVTSARPELADERDPVRYVQQAAGNAGMGVLLGQGRPLDPDLQASFEPTLGRDLGGVRIHDDERAAAAAKELAAEAFTIGDDIAFAAGRYRPGSSAGRALIAHELVHVVQQARATNAPALDGVADPANAFESHAVAAAGPLAAGAPRIGSFPPGTPPSIQRSPDADEERRRRLDEFGAELIGILDSSPAIRSTDMLLTDVRSLREKFADESVPLTRVAAARALIGYTSVLHEREEIAQRDADGALLLEPLFGGAAQPWSAARPHRVDDIPGFGQDAEVSWVVAVQAAEAAARPRRRRGSRPAPQAPPTPPPAVRQHAAPATTFAIESGAVPRPQGTAERNAGETGGAGEIASGIGALHAVSADQATQVVAGREHTSIARPSTWGTASLLDHCAELWYVDRHLYVLDRTGHIVSSELEDVSIDLQGTSLQPGAYYFGPFQISASSGSAAVTDALVKVDGSPQVSSGDVYPARVLTGLLPMLERGRAALGARNGLGLIVSHRIGEPSPSFSGRRLVDALGAAVAELPWALRVRFAEMAEHPLEEVFQVALGLGTGVLLDAIPVVGEVLMAYQAIRLAAWMGSAADIAARARSADEINIAGQAVAKKIADWAVQEVELRVASGGLRTIRGGGEEPTPSVHPDEHAPTELPPTQPTPTEHVPTQPTPTGNATLEPTPTGHATTGPAPVEHATTESVAPHEEALVPPAPAPGSHAPGPSGGPAGPPPVPLTTPPSGGGSGPGPVNEADFGHLNQELGLPHGTAPPTPNRIYPDFHPPGAADGPAAALRATQLTQEMGIPIRADQMLEAPWIGKNTPRSTSEGWLRDSDRFWTAYAQHAPNEYALLQGGRIVTPAYAAAMGWPPATIGRPLAHHHVSNGAFVVPVPVGQDFHGPQVHRTPTIHGSPDRGVFRPVSAVGAPQSGLPPQTSPLPAPTLHAGVPVGSSGAPLGVTAPVPAATIGVRTYSSDALAGMQRQGLVPAVVEDAIVSGQETAGPGGTTIYYAQTNDVTAVLNADGQCVYVYRGAAP